MRRRSRLASFLLLMPIAGGILADCEGPSAGQSLVNLLQGIDSLQATFRQDDESRQSTPQTGKLWVRRPDLFRVESGPPLSQTIVSDGNSLWIHDRDLEQVIIRHLDKHAGDIPVLILAGDPARFTAQFEVACFEEEVAQHFVLHNREEQALITTIALWFKQGLPTRIAFDDKTNARTTIEFSQVSALTGEDNERFAFVPPDAVDIIDDRVSP